MLTEAWWFPMLALGAAAFMLTIIFGITSCLIAQRFRRLLGGVLIATLAVAIVISYAYAVLRPSPTYPVAETECSGPPYEVC